NATGERLARCTLRAETCLIRFCRAREQFSLRIGKLATQRDLSVVIALFICLGGVLALPFLPIAQYPIIAPPSISVSTSYPGASPETLYTSVTRLIEEELNGANGILNFESTSDSLGQVEITANFVPGTDPSMASVEVQNRIKRVEARLPRAVIQQ